MNRRRLLPALLGPGFAPLGLRAQQRGKVWHIGYLASLPRTSQAFPMFREGMRELDYVEGKNLVIEARFADGVYERLPALADELVQLKMDVIVADSSPAIRAAQKATDTIPIVMGSTGDPVGSGFVKSLSRPGGNITGIAIMSSDLSPKLLELLHEAVPHLSRVAVLVSPTSSTYRALLNDVQSAAKNVGVEVVPIEASTPPEIESGFSAMVQSKAEAVIVGLTPFFVQQQRQIIE